MIKKIIPILAALALFLTACGGQEAAVPTMSPEEVQGTAVAAAWTMVAMTQAAIPTATPLPPTETPSPTPLPTFTPLPLPTQPLVLPTATQVTSGGGGTCDSIINLGEAGPVSNVRFENASGGTSVSLSLYMYDPNLFGQCGSLPSNPYVLGKNEKLTVSLPKGNYYAYAWITFPGGKLGSAEGYFINKVGDNHLFPVLIKEVVIVSK